MWHGSVTRKLISRRDFVGGSISATLAALSAVNPGAANRTTNPLKIPDLIKGTGETTKSFNLSIEEGTSVFLPGRSTPTYGINAPYLGPTIRVRNGDRVTMRVMNNLDESTTLHWHGLHVPAHCDGGPHQIIEPGEIWDPTFVIKQLKASLCWYHAHPEGRTGEQVLRGLAGLFLIDDEESDALGLPSEYGVDDIPLIIQDRRFDSEGRFEYVTNMGEVELGYMGDTILVNGTIAPHFDVKRQRTRLRILNGSNARIYNLGWSDGADLVVIGTDGSLLARPVRLRRVRLGPGERIELLVDVQSGWNATLASYPVGPQEAAFPGTGVGDEVLHIVQLRADRPEAALLPMPDRLVEVPHWSAGQAARTRRFTLDMTTMSLGSTIGPSMHGAMGINGRSMDMARIDERVPLDSIEIWEIENRTQLTHPFHVHDIQFRVLDRDGAPPLLHEQGLKDTVLVDPGSTVRVIAQFSDFADPEHPYMYHCHILEHEDAGMMGQFVVV